MPALAPTTEAMQAIRDRINTGSGYALDETVAYSELTVDPLEDFEGNTRVDVTAEDSWQLNEMLDVQDRHSVVIRVWIRAKLVNSADAQSEINDLMLLVHQIYQRVNSYRDGSNRVVVWEGATDPEQMPNKRALRTNGMFIAGLVFRVEVDP